MVERIIPFPSQSAPGSRQQEAGGRIVNGYVEALGTKGPAKFAIRRMPGLLPFGTTARAGYRGSLLSQGVLYSAFGTKLESHTAAGGASTSIGTLNGTKRGFFAANNNATPDKFFTDPDGNIATFTPGAVTNGYPDPDLPAPNSLDFLDGFTVFTIADGRFFATDLNTTNVNALSFGRAQAKPGGLTLVRQWGGRMLVLRADRHRGLDRPGHDTVPARSRRGDPARHSRSLLHVRHRRRFREGPHLGCR